MSAAVSIGTVERLAGAVLDYGIGEGADGEVSEGDLRLRREHRRSGQWLVLLRGAGYCPTRIGAVAVPTYNESSDSDARVLAAALVAQANTTTCCGCRQPYRFDLAEDAAAHDACEERRDSRVERVVFGEAGA